MVVQHNMQAMNANRMLGVTMGAQAKSTEKLSSGYKINRAADDAAGLSISEKMRKQIRGLDQASTNAEDGVSAVQTAEGALTEVHSMLQRMNELAVQAANGTMSANDRGNIQDEIDQLVTEIDRVAETTKFNETYLLKGNAIEETKYLAAHDAGFEGSIIETDTKATFVMKALKLGDTISIGGKNYTVGGTTTAVVNSIQGHISTGDTVIINGKSYEIGTLNTLEGKVDENYIKTKLIKGDTTIKLSNGKTYAVVKSDSSRNVETDTVLTTTELYTKINDELTRANKVGDTEGSGGSQEVTAGRTATATVAKFTIDKGSTKVMGSMEVGLHVGADADGTNKISMKIEAMSAKNLGVKGLNVVDKTGAAASYAIDAIADAVAKVSKQRSALGAVQNRLEHTIANLDNVVENTTSAESRIRDTDMAEEMVSYSKNNILQQAGQSMLAQANQSNQGVLSLLQ